MWGEKTLNLRFYADFLTAAIVNKVSLTLVLEKRPLARLLTLEKLFHNQHTLPVKKFSNLKVGSQSLLDRVRLLIVDCVDLRI